MRLFRFVSGLPSVAKIALAAALVFVGYLLVVEPVVERIAVLNTRAEDAAKAGEALDSRSRNNQQTLSRVTTGERRFGIVEPPADYEARLDEFNTRVNGILRDAGVRDITIANRTARAPKGDLDRFAASGHQIERAIKDIRFTATPEEFTRVLSAIEQLPVVSGVTRVNVQRESDGSRRVRVDLSAETWVLVSSGRSA